MTANEAHQYALDLVEEFRAAGVKVFVKPYPQERKTPQLLADYSGPERAKHDRWCSVRFNANEEQSEQIHEKLKALNWMGVTFDTGGGMGVQDWELDWSFRYRPGNIDSMREENLEMIRDLQRHMAEGETP